MNIKAKSDSEDIRIYFDNILHLRFPRNKNIILQSCIQNNTKLYYIQINIDNRILKIEYENKDTWKEVLKLLNIYIYEHPHKQRSI
jgi:hypothetical protein